MKITIKLIEQFNFGKVEKNNLDTETKNKLQYISEQAGMNYRPKNGATRHCWNKTQKREFARLAKQYT